MYISLDCYDTDDTARGTRVFLSTKKRLSLYSMPFRLDLTYVLNDDNADDDDDDDDDDHFLIMLISINAFAADCKSKKVIAIIK